MESPQTTDEFNLPSEHSDKIELSLESADEGENCLALDDGE
jgi:hypothetical protein